MQRQTKTIKPASMIRAQDKENKGPRSLVPVSAVLTVSDSDDDKPARPEGRMKAYKELQFGNSPAKRNALGVKQDKVIGKNTMISHQRSSPADTRAKSRSKNASHHLVLGADM